jgi:hypothetical protein
MIVKQSSAKTCFIGLVLYGVAQGHPTATVGGTTDRVASIHAAHAGHVLWIRVETDSLVGNTSLLAAVKPHVLGLLR